ncbi:hypothetical protein BN946_scf184980.g40 [Trametes cinnabarina]|uniref:Peptidase S33 tripeptidyl aminopeptidase-like C-terminal domain-containing protein n=1 Tax=Pycnoporus cinnabarinus TaxID=5643 RepID=A0A060SJU7_PYCCI|nr:hypothetical protein BN946_scf184980.g40 [Trametes cinnabarina]
MVALADALQGLGTPLNYWGLSYSTMVGAWFMNMFPDRVGNVILDGVLDATSVATKQSYQTVHDHPSASNVTMLMLRAAVYSGLYQPQSWATLANNTLFSDIDSVLHINATQQTRRTLAKRATFSAANSYTEPAVVCADSVDADTSLSMKDIFDEIVNVTRTVSPSLVGAFWPIPWHRCLYWPVRAVERYQGPFDRTLANRVLVIGNAYDNATPFFEAEHTADVLGDQAALVKQNGFGYSTCTANIIRGYLANGTLPADHLTVCEVDDFVELFPGVRSASVTVDNAGFKA